MPAGCDFICKNDLCEHEGKLIVLTSPWPMGNIRDVILSLDQNEYPVLVQTLSEKEIHGVKYACIQLPNDHSVETVAYRLNFWHPKQNMVCEYHLELNGRALEEALKDPKIPTLCPETNEKLVSFEEMVEDDICCPYCNEPMNKTRWLSNE
jgi:hypothetical protein